MAKTIADLGGLHILVNNAGVELPEPLIDTTKDEYDRMMATNLKSMVLCSKAAGAHLIAQRFGRVVNMSQSAPSPPQVIRQSPTQIRQRSRT